MVTPRAKELLVGVGLAHLLASFDRIVRERDFTPMQQERIAMQLFSVEAECEAESPQQARTVH